MQFITNNSYCFKFDLHSAYHHVDIFKSHTDYLGFSWCYGNGLTTIGLLSHSSIRPLISKSCIASTTNSLWLTADLLLDKQIEGGVLKNGILYHCI
jgi:hypothetical protein